MGNVRKKTKNRRSCYVIPTEAMDSDCVFVWDDYYDIVNIIECTDDNENNRVSRSRLFGDWVIQNPRGSRSGRDFLNDFDEYMRSQ